MSISMQGSKEELFALWIKYSAVYKNNTDSQEEIRDRRKVVRSELEKKGITEVEMFGIDGDTYTLRYLYHGSRVLVKVEVPATN